MANIVVQDDKILRQLVQRAGRIPPWRLTRRTLNACTGPLSRQVYSALAGRRIVRHIWAAGELSLPRPSSGCLKWRPIISSKSSMTT